MFQQLEEAKNRLGFAKQEKGMVEKIQSTQIGNQNTRTQLTKNDADVKQMEKLNALRELGINLTSKQLQEYEAAIDCIGKANYLQSLGIEIADGQVSRLEKYVAQLRAAEREQRKLNLASSMLKDNKNARYTGMEKIGYGEQAAKFRYRDQASDTLGRKLTQQETALVDSFASLQYKINNWQMPQVKDDVIHTNDLARRGGFNSSVVVEKHDNSKQILGAVKTMQGLLSESVGIEKRIYTYFSNGF